MSQEEISEEEFEKRLEIANTFINSYFYLYYDDSDSNFIYKKINSLLDDEASRIFSAISAVEQDLEHQKLKLAEEVLKIVYNKSYINTDDMTYEELKKLHEEIGFEEEDFCDDCIILGYVKLTIGYAIIYTYSLPKQKEMDIEYEILKKQD